MLSAGLLGFLVLLVGFAVFFARKATSLSDFFLAGRQFAVWPVTLAFVASWFGAGSIVVTMDKAAAEGFQAFWLIAVPSLLTCLLVGRCLAGPIRSSGTFSPTEALGNTYGPLAATLVSWVILATTTTYMASQLIIAGQALSAAAGMDAAWAMSAVMATVVGYSVLGGFRVVVWTDMLQFGLFTLSLLVLLAYVMALPSLPVALIPALPKNFWQPFADWSRHMGLVLAFVPAWSLMPEMWQRMASAQNPNAARKAAIQAGWILAALYAVVIAVGMLATVKLQAGSGSTVLVGLTQSMPWPALSLLVLLGLLSAITSTLDSTLNVATLTLSRDILGGFNLVKRLSETRRVILSRIVMLLVPIPAVGLALYQRDVVQTLWISADIYASTVLVPILTMFYLPRVSRLSGVTAMGFGLVPPLANFLGQTLHWIALPEWWPVWPYTTLLGIGASALGFAIGHWLPGPLAVPPKATADRAEPETVVAG